MNEQYGHNLNIIYYWLWHYNFHYKLISKVCQLSLTRVRITTAGKQNEKRAGAVLITLCPGLTSLAKDMVSSSRE